jgi:hypothetical protein
MVFWNLFPLKSSTVEEMALFEIKWGVFEAVHGTQAVVRRDPRHKYMEDIVSLGLSVGVYVYAINV